VSAVQGWFVNEEPEVSQAPAGEPEDPDESMASFWQWFALAVLLFAWIAEATMCADRGF
jgi:hypothetical protein